MGELTEKQFRKKLRQAKTPAHPTTGYWVAGVVAAFGVMSTFWAESDGMWESGITMFVFSTALIVRTFHLNRRGGVRR